jgi:hypothetical protein
MPAATNTPAAAALNSNFFMQYLLGMTGER